MESLRVYTIPECPFCLRVKQFLDRQKVNYIEINVEEDIESWQKVYAKTKQDVVPILEKKGKLLVAKPGIGISESEIKAFLK